MIGECPICGKKGTQLTEHHVVEAPLDENDNTPSIAICKPCHVLHEKYVNYLRDKCSIDLRKKC